ncbi:NAD(P)H-dependent glycerol-3-phosphate dehydrogenase [Salisediminibacterium halotolerans]|uniref:NAD(P)H-dependent glycerol-3-phosphate dehydrogenase n=1 Tax=Salisediminibacterium halotolerans TaxID=517425 RepID=UPI000EABD4B4|nr:NAD(P)H-dependent glycerol-3-phosphate dehydrogenase [Salisediminibacterium halotolerans]RLJ77955.1 glycerol 3-phosphate dehydrogenase (NAD(P)+) [Actinophytocola xinjiangensis]RPE88707.1 glycerol 3-phosphate dehydrogenase (NAD(P)+) [Salisediminibacterium halotolerans]TWG36932.1 glycerol 3-phosphate dehydrogenase (NAD(P)+) [Salisediminibacterium halotolerans]GEL08107.1 glycerol-3-phosphate dehydrogenase [NAD(P)+] [Salisediminibacterium halotolerans]
MTRKVAVLGSGSWGTALSIVLADNGHSVHLWGRSEEQVTSINEKRKNSRYIKDVELPDGIQASTDIRTILADADYVVIVVPTKAVRDVIQSALPHLNSGALIVHASKGIEPETHLRISEMIHEELPEGHNHPIAALSGPSHAEEVCYRQPTTVTCSSEDEEAAKSVQDLFMNQSFRVYTNIDIIGVEMGGALKNIIAIGAGMTNGLGFGDNARAALMTRGLAEIARLGMKLGANPMTFAGLSGLGDLIVTCTSEHSRNWRAGKRLGEGISAKQVEDEMGMVVEGIRTTKAAHQLAEKVNVDMPITSELFHVLFDDKPPKEAVAELMGRVKKHEVEDLKLNDKDPLNYFEP